MYLSCEFCVKKGFNGAQPLEIMQKETVIYQWHEQFRGGQVEHCVRNRSTHADRWTGPQTSRCQTGTDNTQLQTKNYMFWMTRLIWFLRLQYYWRRDMGLLVNTTKFEPNLIIVTNFMTVWKKKSRKHDVAYGPTLYIVLSKIIEVYLKVAVVGYRFWSDKACTLKRKRILS